MPTAKRNLNVVIVTGADNGIGLHMTGALLEEGYHVAGFDLASKNLSQIHQQFADQLVICHTDVTCPSNVEESIGKVIAKWGQVDILVNNACLAIFCPFEEKSLSDTMREFEVNYFGYLHLIHAVLPYMKQRKRGQIHNVSSGVGITGFPGIFGYASTKGAIEALSLTLSIELEKHGISVSVMHPPLTNTRSAAPLGIPAQVMADPKKVGRNLAKQILSRKSVITPDLQTTVYLALSRRFPRMVGRFLAKMTEKGRRVDAAT